MIIISFSIQTVLMICFKDPSGIVSPFLLLSFSFVWYKEVISLLFAAKTLSLSSVDSLRELYLLDVHPYFLVGISEIPSAKIWDVATFKVFFLPQNFLHVKLMTFLLIEGYCSVVSFRIFVICPYKIILFTEVVAT